MMRTTTKKTMKMAKTNRIRTDSPDPGSTKDVFEVKNIQEALNEDLAMIRKAVLTFCLITLAGLWHLGCKEPAAKEEPGYEVGTMEEYRQEAEADITEENAEGELSRLQAKKALATDKTIKVIDLISENFLASAFTSFNFFFNLSPDFTFIGSFFSNPGFCLLDSEPAEGLFASEFLSFLASSFLSLFSFCFNRFVSITIAHVLNLS